MFPGRLNLIDEATAMATAEIFTLSSGLEMTRPHKIGNRSDGNVAYQYLRFAENNGYIENVVVPNEIDSYLTTGGVSKFHLIKLKLPKMVFFHNTVTYLYGVTLSTGTKINVSTRLKKQMIPVKLFFILLNIGVAAPIIFIFWFLNAIGVLPSIFAYALDIIFLYGAFRWFNADFPLELMAQQVEST